MNFLEEIEEWFFERIRENTKQFLPIIYGIKEGETNYSIITPPHGYDIGAIDSEKGLVIAGVGLEAARKKDLDKGKVFQYNKGKLIPTDLKTDVVKPLPSIRNPHYIE